MPSPPRVMQRSTSAGSSSTNVTPSSSPPREPPLGRSRSATTSSHPACSAARAAAMIAVLGVARPRVREDGDPPHRDHLVDQSLRIRDPARRRAEADEELLVALRPGHAGRRRRRACTRPRRAAAATTFATASRRSSPERTTPPLPTRPLPSSNCGLTIASTSPSSAMAAATGSRILAIEMKLTSITARAAANGSRSGLEVTGVHALDDDHPLVVAQPPVELPGADVEGDHARGAVLQQAIGEPARGCADVEAVEPVHVDRRARRAPPRA